MRRSWQWRWNSGNIRCHIDCVLTGGLPHAKTSFHMLISSMMSIWPSIGQILYRCATVYLQISWPSRYCVVPQDKVSYGVGSGRELPFALHNLVPSSARGSKTGQPSMISKMPLPGSQRRIILDLPHSSPSHFPVACGTRHVLQLIAPQRHAPTFVLCCSRALPGILSH